MSGVIPTRFLVLSDTHGEEMDLNLSDSFDVAIHCGDLTEESKIREFKTSINLLKRIKAPLKLVIAGNHDFTLDVPMFRKKLADVHFPLEQEVIEREYGAFGEARELFEAEDAKAAGIVFLDEGTHTFKLANGAALRVYASPYTPSVNDWGFQYNPQEGHTWSIGSDVDVAITHGPPRGIMDYTDDRKRAGCPGLFAAIARARPRMHCFGHMHTGGGAKLVTWRETASENPSHFTDIDNDESKVIENLAGLHARKFDLPELVEEKKERLAKLTQEKCCSVGHSIESDRQTMFVNAAIEGSEEQPKQLPWSVSIDLPRCSEKLVVDKSMTTPSKRKLDDDDGDASSAKRRRTDTPASA